MKRRFGVLLLAGGLLAAARPAAATLAVYQGSISPNEGPFTGALNTFTDSVTTRMPSDYTATILWSDDNTTSAGTITGSNGSFVVSGSHTIPDEEVYKTEAYVTVTVNATMETQTNGVFIDINEADALSGTPVQFTATAGFSFTMVVGNFTDTFTGNQPSDFTSEIGWGDGTYTYPATVTGSGGSFSVAGTHTYTQAGRFDIQVSLTDPGHFVSTYAMVTSIVDVTAPATPGLLVFSSGSYSAVESAGSATVTVARVGGTSGAVAVSYATSDGTGTAGRDYTPVSGTLSWADGDVAPKTFTVPLLADPFLAASETVNLTLADPTGGAALASPSAAVLTITNGSCGASDQALCLDGGRFRVQATWQTSGRSSGPGHASPLTDNAGTFWFFDPANVELIVKVLDGCAVNGHFWFFAAGLTDVAVSLNVTDAQTGAMRTYTNPRGTAYLPVQDINAFSTCP
jgi:hypothetical protein